MAIHFISGKPGGGKSLFSTQEIVRFITQTDRIIVTNVPIKLDNLQHYLHDLGHTIHVQDRVRILDEDETRVFWRARGFQTLPPEEKDGEINFSLLPEVKPVVYFIDEIHLFFNSREWQKTGKTAIRYLSQHRHLGDEVYCITQSIANVDKQFRSLAQDFTYLRNMRAESWGWFAAPNKFVATTYLSPAESSTTAIGKQEFKLDIKGLASCYDTSGGVGMPGGTGGDKGKRGKGLPTWTFIPIACLIAFLGWYLIAKGVPGLISGHVSKRALEYAHLNDKALPDPPNPKSGGLNDSPPRVLPLVSNISGPGVVPTQSSSFLIHNEKYTQNENGVVTDYKRGFGGYFVGGDFFPDKNLRATDYYRVSVSSGTQGFK